MKPEKAPPLSAQISALHRRLDGVLDSFWVFVVSLFSKLPASLKKLPYPITMEDDTENEGSGRPPKPPVVSKVVPTPPSQNESEKCRYPHTPWWKTLAEMLGIMAVIAYAFITYCQWQTAKDTLVASERSWIGPSNPAFNVGEYHQGVPTLGPINPDVPLNANFVFENFGKTPADVDRIGFAIEVRPNEVPEDFQYTNIKAGQTVFPSQKMHTVNSNIVSISLPDFPLVKNQTKRFVLHGIVQYHDSFGPHETKFCFLWSGEGTDFLGCLEHNHAN